MTGNPITSLYAIPMILSWSCSCMILLPSQWIMHAPKNQAKHNQPAAGAQNSCARVSAVCRWDRSTHSLSLSGTALNLLSTISDRIDGIVLALHAKYQITLGGMDCYDFYKSKPSRYGFVFKGASHVVSIPHPSTPPPPPSSQPSGGAGGGGGGSKCSLVREFALPSE